MKTFFENFSNKLQSNVNTSKRKILSWILISLAVPLLVIDMHRLHLGIYHLYIALTVCLLIYGFFIAKKEMRKEDIIYYTVLPPILPIIINIAASLISSLFIDNSNPQNLSSHSLSDLIVGIGRSILAGSEEVWRYIVMSIMIYSFVTIFKKCKYTKLISMFSILFSLLLSSFLFGWLHTFGYSSGWMNYDITISLSVSGFMFGLIIILTNRLWCAILTHIISDVYTHINLYNPSLYVLTLQIISLIIVAFYFLDIYKQRKTT